ncbi:hypothetical protein EI71_00836 [Anaeroplasma bactoclasticum]|uniref:Uncharacterized protein n=2 Tax=Anaeroplasma bactoclasticum TaxID=2088 RepID=A0A397RZL6_9MOLU|nr:hypothetical protein EI71_00836 [Anaeroplasma bactoclasticum]
MKDYKFYGAKNADIKDSYGNTPKDYYDILSNLWSKETCAKRMQEDWTKENMTLGQCSITAFLMQDLYGGEVYGIPLSDGNFHCFNKIGDVIFDLTSEQFKDKVLDYQNVFLQDRNIHFQKEEKKNRYLLLKSRLFEIINKWLED